MSTPPTKREFVEQAVALVGCLAVMFGLIYFFSEDLKEKETPPPTMDASVCLYLGSALKGNKTQLLKCEFEQALCFVTLYPGTSNSSISCVPATPAAP